jgi:hypothetical protein
MGISVQVVDSRWARDHISLCQYPIGPVTVLMDALLTTLIGILLGAALLWFRIRARSQERIRLGQHRYEHQTIPNRRAVNVLEWIQNGGRSFEGLEVEMAMMFVDHRRLPIPREWREEAERKRIAVLTCWTDPILPPELHDIIMSFVGLDPSDGRTSTLFALCLVSRAFHHQAERLLYRSMTLVTAGGNDTRRWYSRLSAITDSLHRSSMVLDLTVNLVGHEALVDLQLYKPLAAALRTVENLKRSVTFFHNTFSLTDMRFSSSFQFIPRLHSARQRRWSFRRTNVREHITFTSVSARMFQKFLI